MSADLREQVARRLLEIDLSIPGVDERRVEMIDQTHLAMADEVIRCMEWARRVGTGKPQTVLRPLTLPPEDWRAT